MACVRYDVHRIKVAPALFWVQEPAVSKAAIPSYLEIIDFIANGTTPQAVADYRPSAEAQRRIAELIAQEKEGSLSVEEVRTGSLHGFGAHPPGSEGSRQTDSRQWLMK